jgi:hypothetical protein
MVALHFGVRVRNTVGHLEVAVCIGLGIARAQLWHAVHERDLLDLVARDCDGLFRSSLLAAAIFWNAVVPENAVLVRLAKAIAEHWEAILNRGFLEATARGLVSGWGLLSVPALGAFCAVGSFRACSVWALEADLGNREQHNKAEKGSH